MHCVVSIDSREDIASGHLLSKRQERLDDRVQLLAKARRELLLKLNQQAGNNHPEKYPIHVGALWAGLFDDAAEFFKSAGGGLTAFQHCRVNATIAWCGTPGDTHPFDLTVARLQVAANLGGQGVPVSLIGTGQQVQQCCCVAHCAGDRPFMVEDIPAIVARPGRNAPELGFEAIDYTHGSWHPDGAPPSLPTASGPIPAATWAAAPPDEPPGERLRSDGWLVAPNTILSVANLPP